ncbi:AraC family transcriptional regulator [Cohnella sp. JJ-181]|uniref:AraC family transcriptional regulator n=1 Tax=Cohnella rhizoplanae TaxID=2974897 RepID=UPI00232B5027|nr:AraC family transcriptional regulator [Cohnella sp. JJ-181]
MKLYQILKSKKYLLRILLSISVITAFILIGSSVSFYYLSTKSIIKMQKEYHEATLAQINYNISYMDEIAKNMITFLFWDSELTALRTDENVEILDLVKKLNKLDTIVRSSSFLDSIVVYNGHSKQLLSGGNAKFRSQVSEESRRLLQYLNHADIQKMKLVPMKLTDSSTNIDWFSYIIYEELGPYSAGDSALIINIKPEWLINNIKLINEWAVKQEGAIILMDKEGNRLSSNGKPGEDTEPLRAAIEQHAVQNSSGGYFIHEIGGEKQIVSYSSTIIPDWYAVSLQPYSAVIHNTRQIRKLSIATTVIFLLMAAVASFFVSRRLYMPVGRLFSQVRIGHGHEDNTGKDELSFLSDTYKRVMDNLHEVTRFQTDHRDIVQMYYFRKVLAESADYNQERFTSTVRLNGLNISEEGSYCLLLISMDGIGKMSRLLQANDIKLFHFAIMNIAEEIINQEYRCTGAEMRADHLVFLVSAGQALDADRLVEMVKQIQNTLSRYYKITASAALSDPFDRYTEITEQYGRTQQAIRYKLVFGRESIITPGMMEDNIRHAPSHMPPELERKIVEGIKSGDSQRIDASLDKFVQYLASCPYDQIMTNIMQITITIRQTLKEMNDHRVLPIDIDMNALSMRIWEMESLEEIRQVILQSMKEINQQKTDDSGGRNDILVTTIKDIVRQNHADLNLSLQTIATMMKLSADYMGRMFKKSEMMSVADYINEVRLNHAKEMLENEKYTITEIMEKVGFANQSYFFKLFKKKLGSTPGDYRLKKSLHKQGLS